MLMTEPVEHCVRAGDVDLCYFEWGEPDDEPTILLVHATGFHARCWDQTVAHLPGRHVIAVDMRGHGRSEKKPPYNWRTFGRDLAAFVSALDLHQLVAAGHSMGGHSLVQAAAADPGRFDRLVLVDPVMLPPAAYDQFQPQSPEAHPVARRRNVFESPKAMAANLAGRGGYAHFLQAALDDYCRFGLLPNPDGDGFVLACPPLVEATIYTGSAEASIFDLCSQVHCPVTVLRAAPREPGETQMDFSKSPTWPDLATQFENGVDDFHPELSHFIPMQAPELVAQHCS